jgi:hypothetical protein
LAASPALSAEPLGDRMRELLPKPLDGWSSTGAKSKTVPKGPSKGAIVFQVYQNKARTVIVRFTENPPALIRKIISEPGEYGYGPFSLGDRKAVIKDRDGRGTLMVKLTRFVLAVDWSGAATRKDAMQYVRHIDIDALDRLN